MDQMMASHLTRTAIVTEARSWIGTRYRHQGSMKGVGCDCLGLVRGVWRNSIAGRSAGALAGNSNDRPLFGSSARSVTGPRLADLDVMAPTDGSPIPRLY